MKKTEQDSDHAWFKERIGAFVAGGLDADDSKRFNAHQNQCPDCATRLEKIAHVDTAMQDALRDLQPRGIGHLDARIIQALRKEDAKRSRFSPFFKNAAAACAAMVLCGVLGFLIDGMQHGKIQDQLRKREDSVAMLTEPEKPKLDSDTSGHTSQWGYPTNYDTDKKDGAYDKVKLGTLGNFQTRDLNTTDAALNGRFYPSDSTLDGTLYSRGIIQDNEHAPLPMLTPAEMAQDFNDRIATTKAGYVFTLQDGPEKRQNQELRLKFNAERDAKQDAQAKLTKVEAAGDITVPLDILSKAEIGDHYEAINPDKPDANWFNPVSGKEAGGGGISGPGVDDLVGVGGQVSPGSGGGWGSGTGNDRASIADRGGRKITVMRHGGKVDEKSTATTPNVPFPGIVAGPQSVGGGTFSTPSYYSYKDQQLAQQAQQLTTDTARFKPSQLQDKKEEQAVLTKTQTVTREIRTYQGDKKDKNGDTKADGDKPATEPPAPPPAEKASPRYIIRNGEMEFEVDSFDSSYVQISKIAAEEGGLIATTNSEKLANGKVKGSVTLRVPPEHLDVLVLKLRALGELKNQRITSQDVSKLYTDTESELRAGRAMEIRLLEMIKTGKGDVSDLLKAEKELAVWREKIEKLEGEIRYYNNLISLSTLILTLSERDLKTPTSATEQQTVNMGIEIEDVEKAYNDALKAIADLKGRVTASELKKYEAGQFGAAITCEIVPEAAGQLQDRLKQLGRVARLNEEHKQTTLGGTGAPAVKVERKETEFSISIYNLANVAPRQTVKLNLAAADTEVAYRAILASIEKADGRVLSSALNRDKPDQTTATVNFEVKAIDADAVQDAVRATGEVMQLNVAENPDTNNVTQVKKGFVVQIYALSQVPPRESSQLDIATLQVAESYKKLSEAVLAAKGRVLVSQLDEKDRQNVTGRLEFELPRAELAAIDKLINSLGDVYANATQRSSDTTSTIDSKKRFAISLFNAERLAPREVTTLAIELSDVDKAATEIAALALAANGRTVESHVSKDRSGRVVGKVIIDVPLSNGTETVSKLRGIGTLRMIEASRNSQVPDGALSRARIDLTLANADVIVPDDKGLASTLRGSFATTVTGLLWSLQLIIVGLCFVGPWALIIWLLVRWYRRSSAKA